MLLLECVTVDSAKKQVTLLHMHRDYVSLVTRINEYSYMQVWIFIAAGDLAISLGHVTLWPLVALLSWSPIIESSHYNSLNSLAPGKFEWNFRHVIFKEILVIDGWGISCEIALIWMSLDFTDDQSTLVQVMAWCHQATSHYLNQCWPRSPTPYGVTRPQWV